jgi:HK97 family phage portal protein
MGLLSFLGLERRAAPQPRSFDEIVARLDGAGGLHEHLSGVSVTQAMQVATVMACVRVIANGCATPELNVYREEADGARQKATDVPEFRVLNRRPNEWQTSFEFRRTMTMHAALTGNALAIKVMVGGRVRELIPVRPGYYEIKDSGRWRTEYRVWDEWGYIGTFGPADVLHLPNWQWDQAKALSAVSMARAAIGLSVAAEANQAALHSNGGRPAGILTSEQKLSPEALDRLKASWREFTRANRNGTAVLDGGMSYQPLTMTGVDAQHLETRRFQVEEICRAFDVFPIMIGHNDKSSTFASSEAFFAAHLKHTLAPWHRLWAQRLDEFVLDGAGPLFAEFDTRYLSAGSMADRAQWARTMAEMGIYTRNELRDEEGKDPLPGLNDPLTPLNMIGTSSEDGDNDPQA